ncbi:MAG: hypothetical protein IPH51_20755 [Rubrivivax sp.]|nr:hypothetical protein [Rubrivivax sp.]MBK8525533.1 hypothetical protein [Rubrivivax sp.]
MLIVFPPSDNSAKFDCPARSIVPGDAYCRFPSQSKGLCPARLDAPLPFPVLKTMCSRTDGASMLMEVQAPADDVTQVLLREIGARLTQRRDAHRDGAADFRAAPGSIRHSRGAAASAA